MKTLVMTKARLSLLWYAINEDCDRADPATGRHSPLVPIVGAKAGRIFNKLMSTIEDHFLNREAPQITTRISGGIRVDWQLEFPEDSELLENELANVLPIPKAREFLFHLGDDEVDLARRFVEVVTRNRLNRNPITRSLVTELDGAFENATDYAPTKDGGVLR